MTAIGFTKQDLVALGQRLLDMQPDPVPKFLLLRDVLQEEAEEDAYHDALIELNTSKWVTRLSESQWQDGTWGRFHTQDTKVKQPFPSTESALRIALDSGLDRDSDIIQKLMPTLCGYVRGDYLWRDWAEKHDNPAAWPIFVRHLSAASLAQIDNEHPLMDEFWQIRRQSVAAAFADGDYNRRAEIDSLVELLECRMKNPVPFHTEHSLINLSSTAGNLPAELEKTAIRWVMDSDLGIYYVSSRKLSNFPTIDEKRFWDWINALYVLSRFPTWPDVCTDAIAWIWDQRRADGLWDTDFKFARKPFTCFPLSDSWRRKDNRIIDYSTRLLVLLTKAAV